MTEDGPTTLPPTVLVNPFSYFNKTSPNSLVLGSLRGQVAGSVITTPQGGIGRNGLWSRPCGERGGIKSEDSGRTSSYSALDLDVLILSV
jgi:hypothetical protein